MKKILFILLLSCLCFVTFANHTKGGWMYYEYIGPGTVDPTKNKYKIVLNLYMICNPNNGQLDQQINFSFYSGSNQFIENVTAPLTDNQNIQNCSSQQCDPCIVNKPDICYKIASYVIEKELAVSIDGYTISYQRCCRISGIVNIINSNTVGDTWTIKIPGNANSPTAPQNSSPKFIANDTAVICANNFFQFNFTAIDTDSLVYDFAPAYEGASTATPNPGFAGVPPYNSVPYQNPYSDFQPLGSSVTINRTNGVVSGIAPGIGIYVITVVVKEYKNGIYIGESRKSLHIQVASCNPLGAQLNPLYSTCDGFTMSFTNGVANPAGTEYFWDFGDPNSGGQNTSTSANPTHTYSDSGIYILKLRVSLNGQCTDSTTSTVRVYPGFFPGFTSQGQCKNTAIQFLDTTRTNYGTVNTWSWNFGDPATLADTSHQKNPTYTYPSSAEYTVTLTVTNSKGCTGTATSVISVKDKPAFTVTNDTLICIIDTLQLNAGGTGTSFWTPNYNINDQNSSTPLVSPDVPTTYYVTFTDPFGCTGKDSVFVNVKNFVTLDAGRDTAICQTENIQLSAISDALNYTWSPSASLNNAAIKNPIATPLATTKFYVIGNIGKCQTIDSLTIKVTPYPIINVTPDTAICTGNSIQLTATGGSIYTWTPAFFLSNPNIPNPVANPNRTIQYVVTVSDTLGCSKPVKDSVIVQVQKVIANAGSRDTTIVVNQPLQLNATGGQFYTWTPTIGLNNPTIANPIAILNNDMQYVVMVSNAIGCFATDTIDIKVYNVSPGLYIPNAFTPNGDGTNDAFRPVALGMKTLSYFRIYNRWGQLMFSTTVPNKGWDGKFKGKEQEGAVYVWIAEGVDYLDKKITKKGTVTLIR